MRHDRPDDYEEYPAPPPGPEQARTVPLDLSAASIPEPPHTYVSSVAPSVIEPVDVTPPAPRPDPVVTGPVTAEPTEPLATEPLATEPLGTEPLGTEPFATEPLAVEPLAAGPVEPALPPRRRPADEEPLDPPDGADTLREYLRRRRRGPLRRLTLYASGVDTRVLHYAAVEEGEFVVQGTLVLLTAVVAAVSALAAASFLTAGHFVLSPVTVLVGLIWGALIFFFDRALVAGTFNPHHFTRAELDALRDPRVASPWAHLVAAEDEFRPRGRRRLGEIVRVFLVASLRIALALATSFIAAEMALFLVFQPEVNARTAYLQQQMQAQRVAAIQAEFDAENAKRSAQRSQLSGATDPDIVRLTKQVDDLTKQLDVARKDLGILQAAAAAELDGDAYTAKLSDGTTVKTTGKRGNGAAAQSLAQRRDTQQAVVNDLAARLARARSTLDSRLARVKKDNAAALSTLDALDNKATADQRDALAAAVADPSAVNGLLIRQAALNKLEYDTHPETVVDDPVPACHGLFAWFCQLRNWILPPTPMGPTVVAYRTIFFVIEILPITYKVISSLRRRRPYDIAKAALEEASGLDSFRLVDRYLHDTAREAAARSDQRASWRQRSETTLYRDSDNHRRGEPAHHYDRHPY